MRGLQDHGVAGTPKYYVANDYETERFTASTEVSQRAFRELYHVGSRYCLIVVEGRPLLSGLVRVMVVVVAGVCVEHPSSVGFVQDQQMTEDLASERPDEPFAVRVHAWGLPCCRSRAAAPDVQCVQNCRFTRAAASALGGRRRVVGNRPPLGLACRN